MNTLLDWGRRCLDWIACKNRYFYFFNFFFILPYYKDYKIQYKIQVFESEIKEKARKPKRNHEAYMKLGLLTKYKSE